MHAKLEATKAYRTFSFKNIIFSYCWQLSEFDYDNFSFTHMAHCQILFH